MVLILSILIKKQKTPLMRVFLLFGRDDNEGLRPSPPLAFARFAVRICSPAKAGQIRQDSSPAPHGSHPLNLNQKTKNPSHEGFLLFGRDDRIRTCGLCVPNATLYQAEPHPVTKIYYHIFFHLSTDKRLRFTF